MKTLYGLVKKILKVLVAALLLLLAAVVLSNLILLPKFYRSAEKEFLLPGIDDAAYCQQGMEYDDETGLLFFTGYMRDNSASPIYLLDPASGETVKTVRLCREDGSPMNTHSGGISLNGDFVYVAGSYECCLYVYSKSEILSAENEADIRSLGIYYTELGEEHGVKVSFVSKDDGRLYVGEFYLPFITLFELRENHKFQTSNGLNHALLVGIPFDGDAPLGLADAPDIAYSLPDCVQSALVHDGKVVMTKSLLHFPARVVTSQPVSEGTIPNPYEQVPFYSLRQEKREFVIPMAEELVIRNGRIYISGELYNYYLPRLGSLWGGEWCWSIAE